MSDRRDLLERIATAHSTRSTSDFGGTRGRSEGITNDDILCALGLCRDGPDDFGPELIELSAMGATYSDAAIVRAARAIMPTAESLFAEHYCWPSNHASRYVTADSPKCIIEAIRYVVAHQCRGRNAGALWTIGRASGRAKKRAEIFAEYVNTVEIMFTAMEGEAMARLRMALYG